MPDSDHSLTPMPRATRQPRVLIVLPQLPQDPGSGAPRAVLSMGELLAREGFDVRCLAVTACETPQAQGRARDLLRSSGVSVRTQRVPYAGGTAVCWTFEKAGVTHLLLDTPGRQVSNWEQSHGRAFDALFTAELGDFAPAVLLTYGASPPERARHAQAQNAGCRVVLSIQNWGYLVPGCLDYADAVLACSAFCARHYQTTVGLRADHLPCPIVHQEVVADEHRPIFFTMVNPAPEKGLMLVARIAEELGTSRPDIPMLFIESRSRAGALRAAGLAGGFDLSRHANVMVAPSVPLPRDIFGPTRALLAPSVWLEPAGRVAAEAVCNAVPPLVSDRGGLAELGNGGGFVLGLPEQLTEQTREPVSRSDAQPWLELICRLADDDAFYQEACQRARAAANLYLPEHLGPRYASYFGRIAGCTPAL